MPPLKSVAKLPSDSVFEAVKKVTPTTIAFPALAAGLSYAAYASDLAVSIWPWRISLIVMLACFLGTASIYAKARRTNALWACGAISAIGMFAAYYFFGVFAYFYYFLFSPMPILVRWSGFLGGAVLTIYWMAVARRGIKHTIEHTSFPKNAFIDDGDVISYDLQKGMRSFERLYKERLPFPKIYSYIVYGIAPFYLILNRLLTTNFGSTGVLLFMAVLGMPMSLWFASVFVRVCLVMVALPIRIEREQRKRVVATM